MFALAPYPVLLVHCVLMGLNKELRMAWCHLYDLGMPSYIAHVCDIRLDV
jgi:hypothetical protein